MIGRTILKNQKQKRKKKAEKGHNLSWEGEKVSKRGRRNSSFRGYDIEIEEEGEIYTNISGKDFHPPTLSKRERVFP